MSAEAARPLTGRRVLAIALAALGLVVAVNAVMVVLALTSFTGVETEDAYVKGLNYDDTLARAEAQRALGWRLAWTQTAARGGQVFTVRLRDKRDAPVTGAGLTLELRRPTNEGQDVSAALAPAGDGSYRSEALPLAPGNWNLAILVARGGETVFRREDRVWVKP